MRSHRRRGPLPHVLVAGDVTELESIRALLALLPGTAYGQVFVELDPADAEPPVLSAPPRVGVTFLGRSATEPGSRLAAAVAGWVGEWMPDQHAVDRDLTVWVGAAAQGDLHLPGARLQAL